MIVSLRQTLSGLQKVYGRPSYLVGSALLVLLILFFVAWLQNLNFLGHVVFGRELSLEARWSILLSSPGLLLANQTPLSLGLIIIIACLTAMNVALLIYYFRRRVVLASAATTGFFGFLSAVLGIGCAACGSVILSGLLGLSTTAVFIGYLPWRGLEFSFLSIILLLASLMIVGKKIQQPLVCPPTHH